MCLREHAEDERGVSLGVRAFRRSCLTLLLWITVVPTSALADADEPHGWSFALSVGMLGQVQYAEGRGSSTFAASDRFQPSVRDDPIMLVPVIPTGLHVEAPILEGLDGRWGARAFLHARLVIPIDEDRSLARQGTIPNAVEIPTPFPESVEADAISGQGTLVRAILGESGQLGAGVSVDLPSEGVPARFGLSVDYYLQRLTVDGRVVRVTEPVRNMPPVPREFVVQNIGGSEETLMHYLGPRTELAFAVWEEGPFEMAVTAELGAFLSIGDRSKSFSASDGTDSARFEVEVDPWIVHAGVGLRIAWKGLR